MSVRRSVFTSTQFLRDLRRLGKKYPHVDEAVEELIDRLEAGELPGDRLTNLAPAIVYKVRLPNRDAQRGQSGGYRVIYYLTTPTHIALVTMYAKSEQDDVATERIRRLLADYNAGG